MKVEEMIAKLSKIKEEHGSVDVVLLVNDCRVFDIKSIYKDEEYMECFIECEDH